MNNSDLPEETLDPDDWDALRALGHTMLDDMLTYLQTVRERPVWQPMPEAARAALRQPLPRAPEGSAAAYADFQANVLPYPLGNIHPRFWGWVIGTGTPFGMLAEMLSAGMNSNVFGGDQAPHHVETQVIDWCKELLGYPADASGLLVSGGSMANTVALTAARNACAGFDVRQAGLSAAPQPLVMYGSTETHSSVARAAELLGLGQAGWRRVPVNANYEIDLAALEAMLAADKAAGLRPFCVLGNAGTVNTGATDDLAALADIAEREDLWFHVDGAFGAVAALAPAVQPRLAAMARADSLAFDLHKWLYMPYEAGCVLVRDRAAHRNAFSTTATYLKRAAQGLATGNDWFSDYGLQLSREFRALKVWLSLKEHGADKYARLVQQNIAQATYLADLVDATPNLERLAPAPLNIVCLRYNPGGRDEAALNQLNEALLVKLYASGVAAPSSTVLGGRYAIRVAITNHRSRREDFDQLVAAVVALGAAL